MAKQHKVIVLPGLGRQRDYNIQIKLLNHWQKLGLSVYLYPIHWSSNQTFDYKFKEVLKLIDKFAADGSQVSLVGISAGASMALNAYSARANKISKVVFICGKLANTKPVNQRYFVANPAFKKSLEMGDVSLAKLTPKDKAKILSIRALYDNVLSPSANYIPGANRKVVLSLGHVVTILYVLALRGRLVAGFIKS